MLLKSVLALICRLWSRSRPRYLLSVYRGAVNGPWEQDYIESQSALQGPVPASSLNDARKRTQGSPLARVFQ